MRFWNSSTYDAILDTTFNFATCGWKHVALVRSGTKIRAYLDYVCVREFDCAMVTPGTVNAADLIFGDSRTNYPNVPFYGRVAAIRVTAGARDAQTFLYAERKKRGAINEKVIEGDYVVAAAGETYERVVVRGDATITGGKLSLTDGLRVESGSVTMANAGLEISMPVKFDVRKDASLTMQAPISGEENFVVDTAGTTVFAVDNTFTGELTVQGGGEFHAAADGAFGSTDVKTILRSSKDDPCGVATKIYFDGITTVEPFDVYSDSDAGNAHLFFAQGTRNVLGGTIEYRQGRGNMSFAANSETIFSGKLLNLDYITSWGAAGAQIEFNNTVSAQRFSYSNGTYLFNARVASFNAPNYGLLLNANTTVYRMGCVNVFAASEEATAAHLGAMLRFDSAGTFDLNGYDQRMVGVVGAAPGTITSQEPATLHLDSQKTTSATGRNTFAGTATGAVTISSEGPVPLDLTGKSTSTGELVAKNGARICLTSGSCWNGSTVRVIGAGSVVTLAGLSVVGEETELVAEDGGAFEIPSETSVMVTRLTAPDGTVYTAQGTYGAPGSGAQHELDWLTGSGMLVIAARSAQTMTWQPADPSAAGTAMGTATNWEKGQIPDFESGIDLARFPAGTERATVNVPAALAGVTVALHPDESFTFAAGGSPLSLGAEGLKVEFVDAEAGLRVVTNEAPLQLASAQTWTLPGSETVVVQKGMLSGGDRSSLRLLGNADVHFMGDNSAFLGNLNVEGGEELCPGCVVHVWDDHALGSGTVSASSPYQGTGKQKVTFFQFHGDRKIGNPFTFSFTDAKKFGVDAGARVEFTNYADFNGIVRPVSGSGSEIVFSGGARTVCYRAVPPPGGKVIITNTPCAIASYNGTNYSVSRADQGILEIWTSGNSYATTSGYGFEYCGNILIDLHAEKAISREACAVDGGFMPKIRFGNNNGSFWTCLRLNGFNQECAYLEEQIYAGSTPDEDSHAVVESETPAQLNVLQSCKDVRELAHVAWEGAAGLTLEGTTVLRITGQESSTTGRLEVAGGNLELGAKWPNVSEVAVRSGSFKALASNLFNRSTTELCLESGATFNLAGTDQVVQSIRVDGVLLGQRTYKAGDPALKGILQGAGTLTAYGKGPGSVLILR